ncbi:MAG: DUF362 domain-containing protein, partial [Promethearchaeota archaeon]
MTKVYISDTIQGINSAVKEIFTGIQNSGTEILKSSKDVYIKVNGIDFKKHCYTSPEVLESVIKYLKALGANVYVMENSTQSNMTRVVFAATGYKKICKKLNVKIIYLDEEKTETFEFRGKPSKKEDPKGYILKTFRLPKTVVKIINNRDSITYINIPKLKTHSMTVVTLGIKNQWGFPQHEDRGKDHNFNLHSKIVDVYEYIKPDITIIDGTEGTIHGHYPPTAFENRLVIPFKILIGGTDTVAVDAVGARIFGFTMYDVPYLKIAHERGLGIADLNQIEVIGKNLNDYKEKYDWDLLQEFPKDVKIVKGKELLCREGCQNNPLALLQVLAYDFPNKFKGGWFLIMGKGHDNDLIKTLKSEGYTKGLVTGFCAIDEVGNKLKSAFGKKNVYFSGDCNNLAKTATAMFKLSSISPMDLVAGHLSTFKLIRLLISAKLHGSKA